MIVALSIVALGSGCSIQPESAPNDLSAERSDVFGDPATGDVAAGANRVYLLVPADTDQPERLRSVQRDVPMEPEAVLESLFAGPNTEERDEGLDTAIPADVELLSTPPRRRPGTHRRRQRRLRRVEHRQPAARRCADRAHGHHDRWSASGAVAHRRRTEGVAARQR